MLTNTAVLGAVRDEVGWVGWLYSIGSSEGRVVWLGLHSAVVALAAFGV